MDVTTVKTLLSNGVTADALVAQGVSLETIASALSGQTIKANGRTAKPATAAKNGSKVTVMTVAADDNVTAVLKTAKATLEAPEDAARVTYGDKNLAIHRVRKQFENGVGEYIQFSGFKARFGDFALTLTQARMLADENVYAAFIEYMANVPK